MSKRLIKILHLDDDPMMHFKTGASLAENKFGLNLCYQTACDVGSFMDKFSESSPDCVLLDIRIPGPEGGGTKILKDLRDSGFSGVAIMLTAVAQTETILSAVDLGANDFITKGLSEVELAYRITQSLQTLADKPSSFAPLEFAGYTMQQLQSRIPKIVRSPLKAVLVWGESGAGKEIASKLFQSYLGKSVPFIPINCGALVDELIESEFFGHKKGSFTGATANKVGVFKLADKGWIFLDEVANLSMAGQAALLRVLETGEFRSIGGTFNEVVDVRVLAATNVCLDTAVASGHFRGDLLMRLRSYELYLPPLRERASIEVRDILMHLLSRLNNIAATDKAYQLTPESEKILTTYDWKKGNVREMWNTLQAASVNADGPMITVADLPKSIRSSCLNISAASPREDLQQEKQHLPSPALAGASAHSVDMGGYQSAFQAFSGALHEDKELSEVMDIVEKAVISAALERHPSRTAVFQALGISRSSLNQKRQKYSL